MTQVCKVPLVLSPQEEGGYTVTSPVLPAHINTFMGAITIRLSIWQFPILIGWKSSGYGTSGAFCLAMGSISSLGPAALRARWGLDLPRPQ